MSSGWPATVGLNAAATPVILDTDLSTDWDDAMDLKAFLALGYNGTINPLGIAVDTTNAYAAPTADAFRRFYNITDFSVSTSKRSSFDPNGPGYYTQSTALNFQSKYLTAADAPNAVSEMRRLLASRPTNDAVIICTGFMTNLNDLLNSTSDASSSLSGSALLSAKCARIIVAAGYWPNSASSSASAYGHTAGAPEFNLAQAAADSHNFVANCPVPLHFVGVEIGDAVGRFATTLASARPSDDILAWVQRNWNAGTSTAAGTGRPGWGLLALLYVTTPSNFTTTRGTASVDGTTGANTFTVNSTGNHYYVTQVATSASLISQGDNLLLAQLHAPK